MTCLEKEIVFDPPLTEISKEEHDFVTVTVNSTQFESIQWLVDRLMETDLKDRVVVEFQIGKQNQ